MTTQLSKSDLFRAYNAARKLARDGYLDKGRVNRALGLALSKGTRPYATTIETCDCLDRYYRGAACKHQIALLFEEALR